ncbi:MAG TPA: serine/threonine-protein kinase, partial [Polyangiaceae bacterium]|nr:serine/threonine-protein kinase [Polyangiaceae bacterium]
LKILRDAGPRAAARFEREVQALAELEHPNTVRVFDYGVTDDGLLYYAMELLTGVDLATLVRRAGPLSPARAVHMVLAASRALAEAHDKGMVHRDIKPENLFVASAGGELDFVKVLDFGIVRLEEDGAEALTQDGHLAGTPTFMAPEVGRGAEADARSDVYALGAVLYFLLTGRPPFEGRGTAAMLSAHQTEPVMPPSLRMDAPLAKDVEELALRCLAKAPAERPKDAGELAELLGATSLAGAWDPKLASPLPDGSDSIAPGAEASTSHPSDDRATRPLRRRRA